MTDTKKVSIHWRTAAIIAVLASLVCAWKYGSFQNRHAQDDEAKFELAREMTVEKSMEIARKDTLIASLRHDLDSAAQSHAKTQGTIKSDLRAARARYRFRHDTITITLADTIILTQDTLIADLEAEKSVLIDKFTGIVNAAEDKARLSAELATMWEATAVEQNKARVEDQKAWKRQRRKERIVEGLAVAGVIILVIL